MLPRKGQPVRHTASQAPKSRHRRRLPSGTAPLAHLRPGKKNSAPETGTGEVSRLVGGLHRQES